ncbi:hypothetical protein L0Y34_01005 [Candidatus Parcubacteria bacterium]|nr:hypothetical protein [Candidatus Parcubacteria bacterium]
MREAHPQKYKEVRKGTTGESRRLKAQIEHFEKSVQKEKRRKRQQMKKKGALEAFDRTQPFAEKEERLKKLREVSARLAQGRVPKETLGEFEPPATPLTVVKEVVIGPHPKVQREKMRRVRATIEEVERHLQELMAQGPGVALPDITPSARLPKKQGHKTFLDSAVDFVFGVRPARREPKIIELETRRTTVEEDETKASDVEQSSAQESGLLSPSIELPLTLFDEDTLDYIKELPVLSREETFKELMAVGKEFIRAEEEPSKELVDRAIHTIFTYIRARREDPKEILDWAAEQYKIMFTERARRQEAKRLELERTESKERILTPAEREQLKDSFKHIRERGRMSTREADRKLSVVLGRFPYGRVTEQQLEDALIDRARSEYGKKLTEGELLDINNRVQDGLDAADALFEQYRISKKPSAADKIRFALAALALSGLAAGYASVQAAALERPAISKTDGGALNPDELDVYESLQSPATSELREQGEPHPLFPEYLGPHQTDGNFTRISSAENEPAEGGPLYK